MEEERREFQDVEIEVEIRSWVADESGGTATLAAAGLPAVLRDLDGEPVLVAREPEAERGRVLTAEESHGVVMVLSAPTSREQAELLAAAVAVGYSVEPRIAGETWHGIVGTITDPNQGLALVDRDGGTQGLRVLVAHHVESMRIALSWTLAFDFDTSETNSGAEAVDLARMSEYDVVLLPVRIKEGQSNVPAVAAIRDTAPGTQVLALAVAGPEMYMERQELAAMVEAGAVGYIIQDAPHDEFLESIRDAARGAVPLLSTDAWFLRGISQERLRELRGATIEGGERT